MRLPVSLRTLVFLGLALLAGLLAAWAASQHLQSRIRQLEEKARVPMVSRLVAAAPLTKGLRLEIDHLAVREFPADTVSSDSLSPERYHDLVGKVLQSDLLAGDSLLAVHVSTTLNASFSDQIALGRRAITMPVDVINSVSGLLQPGDLIDLYVSFDYRRRRITAPLLQGVQVMATGMRSEHDDADLAGSSMYSTVTLDTSPEDAVKLVAARQSGSITAVLRSRGDTQSSPKAVRGDLASILGIAQGTPVATRKRAQVIYGNAPVRAVNALNPKATQGQPAGVFDLPYLPELVSAWQQMALPQELDDLTLSALSDSSDQFTDEPSNVISDVLSLAAQQSLSRSEDSSQLTDLAVNGSLIEPSHFLRNNGEDGIEGFIEQASQAGAGVFGTADGWAEFGSMASTDRLAEAEGDENGL